MSGSPFTSILTLAVGAVLVCAVSVVWLSSVRSVIRVVALQGVALGLVVLVLGVHLSDPGLIATAAVVLAVKGIAIPILLERAGSGAHTRETRPLVNVPASLVASAVLIVLAFVAARGVAHFVGSTTGGLVPVGVATALLGYFVLVARRRPIFQMVGLLMIDNGIAMVAFLCTAGVPFLIEMGVSLDVLLGVVVLMVLAQRLRSEFGDLDLDELSELHDLMVLVCILVLPLLGGAVIAAGRGRPILGWAGVGANGAALGLGIWIAVRVVRTGPLTGAQGVLRADALSAFMVVVIGVIALLASWIGIRTVALELANGQSTRRRVTTYGVLVQVFVAAMLLAVLAANVGVLWVAVEATTVVTTFLVGHRRTKGALEASWKYIVICSVGIALAFLGTVFVYLAALHAGGHSANALDWTSLMAHARHLDPSVMRLAFALLVLGYGTKVGLAPMHSWLPDAHSQAPAPISALMSGVLLTVAFYAILRFKAVVDLAVGPGFARGLLVIVALLSLAVAASLLLTQRDYKRMLAYHSIEHMGLIALGAAAGIPLAIAALLLHILGHGLAKSVLFLTSGEIMAAEGTSQIDGVRALLARRPALGGVFGIGLVALLGLPPFSLFSSELLMARAEFDVGLGWAAVAAIVAMVVIFVAVVGHARHMLLGPSGTAVVQAPPPGWVAAPLVGGLVICGFIGVFAWPLSGLLEAAAHVVAT